jgi:hypothetical protein
MKLGENFRRKARYCADGHKTETPASVTYSAVLSRDSEKHSSVAYHYIRWAVAAGIISVAWIPTGENLSDVFTKRLAEAVRGYLSVGGPSPDRIGRTRRALVGGDYRTTKESLPLLLLILPF